MTRQLTGLLGYLLLFAFLLFAPAGTLHWPAAWVLLATILVVRGVSMTLLWRSRRALMEARVFVPLPQAGQTVADRLLLPAYMAAYAGQIAFASWDVWHLRLMAMPPMPLRIVGLVTLVAGVWVIYRALRENAFALTVVRMQEDRGQNVVDTGPYAIVRHPMYSGITLVMIGFPLWLGSLAALVMAIVPVTLLGFRIHFEERLLCQQLAGYEAYRQRVRSRIVPGIRWL